VGVDMADDLLDVNRVAVTIASRHESDASRTDAICHGRDIVVHLSDGVRPVVVAVIGCPT